MPGHLKPYKTYVFRDKDPVIDIMRTAVADSDDTQTALATRSGVSPTTMYNWFKGSTRRPQFASVQAVARAMGREFKLVKRSPNGK